MSFLSFLFTSDKVSCKINHQFYRVNIKKTVQQKRHRLETEGSKQKVDFKVTLGSKKEQPIARVLYFIVEYNTVPPFFGLYRLCTRSVRIRNECRFTSVSGVWNSNGKRAKLVNPKGSLNLCTRTVGVSYPGKHSFSDIFNRVFTWKKVDIYRVFFTIIRPVIWRGFEKTLFLNTGY